MAHRISEIVARLDKDSFMASGPGAFRHIPKCVSSAWIGLYAVAIQDTEHYADEAMGSSLVFW